MLNFDLGSLLQRKYVSIKGHGHILLSDRKIRPFRSACDLVLELSHECSSFLLTYRWFNWPNNRAFQSCWRLWKKNNVSHAQKVSSKGTGHAITQLKRHTSDTLTEHAVRKRSSALLCFLQEYGTDDWPKGKSSKTYTENPGLTKT